MSQDPVQALPQSMKRALSSMDVQTVPLASLHLDPANARLHNSRNLDAIKSSLREFGQVENLIVQKSSGKIIGGNGRYQAMRALGWTEATVGFVDLDNTQAMALAIVLNRTAELAEWDDSVLSAQLQNLLDDGLDAKLLGFSKQEIEKIFATLNDDADVDQGEPEEPQLGDALTYSVVVDLATEDAQIYLLQELEAKGHKCRLLIT